MTKIDLSKIKKAPALAPYRLTYTPIAVTAEQMAAADRFADLMSAEIDRRLAEQHRKAMEYLTAPLPFTAPPPPPEPDGIEMRVRSWGYTPIVYQGTFMVGDALDEPADPLDVKYDEWPLRDWLRRDRNGRHEEGGWDGKWPAAARAAVSAHWSAELRAKVAAAKERDRNVVRVDLQDEP